MEVFLFVLVIFGICTVIGGIGDLYFRQEQLQQDYKNHNPVSAGTSAWRIVHDAKYKAWEEYKFSQDGYDKHEPIFIVPRYQHDWKVLYEQELKKLNSKKENEKESDEYWRKANIRYSRWGQYDKVTIKSEFPDNWQLQRLLNCEELHQRILSAEDKIYQYYVVQKHFDDYYKEVCAIIIALAERQAEIYQEFGIDENAQGKLEIKTLWNDLPEIILPKEEQKLFSTTPIKRWFPYPEMDKAYFED